LVVYVLLLSHTKSALILVEMDRAELDVVTALAKKRAALSGDVETTQAKLRQMILDLESLDKTLLMFENTRSNASSPKPSVRLKTGRSAGK
jgi:hypothetical protein